MIQIIKTLQPPAILLGKGKAKCVAMKRLYTRFPSDYLAGSRKFSFDPQVYGHSTVKDALIKAQHGKCCFCESQILHISYGDVEHFRPKAGYCQKASDPIQKPGYYWLAYDWDNLLLCCQLCNQRHKRNLFPLAARSTRARTHNDELALEKPRFINPSRENPENFISFRKEVPYAVRNNLRARSTIEALGLKRAKLGEMRWDLYSMLESMYQITQIAPDHPGDRKWQELFSKAQAALKNAVKDSAQYAGMARSAVANNFQL